LDDTEYLIGNNVEGNCRELIGGTLRSLPGELRKTKRNLRIITALFEIQTGQRLKVAIFCDIAPCNPYYNRRFEGTYNLHLARILPTQLLHAGFLLS
jgi:hypothetical protein